MLNAQSTISSLYRARRHAKPLRKGATLLEMSIWLLIFVGIVVSVLSVASMVLSQNTAAQETQTIAQLTTEARKLRSASGYSETIVEDMRLMRSIPNTVSDPTPDGTGKVLNNSWGGEITFTQVDNGANFAMTYTNIPQTECIQLVQSVRAGLLQSIGKGTAASGSIVSLSPTIIANQICTEESDNQVTWSTKVLAGFTST